MRFAAMFCCLFLAAASFGQDATPKNAYVPDSATALRIAEAVLVPVFGQDKIETQRPFTAKLKDDVWTVSGTLYCASAQTQFPKFSYPCGGVLEVRISKSDAHVLEMHPRK